MGGKPRHTHTHTLKSLKIAVKPKLSFGLKSGIEEDTAAGSAAEGLSRAQDLQLFSIEKQNELTLH